MGSSPDAKLWSRAPLVIWHITFQDLGLLLPQRLQTKNQGQISLLKSSTICKDKQLTTAPCHQHCTTSLASQNQPTWPYSPCHYHPIQNPRNTLLAASSPSHCHHPKL